MLDGLFVAPAATAIRDALASAHATEGPLVVVGNARLAAALREKREVIAVGMTARAQKKHGASLADTSTLAPASVAAVIADVADTAALREWSRVVRDGGTIVTLDKGHAEEASRRALCAGLTEIEQRHAGRTVITSGLVTHF